jgi:hypothetical protein
VGGRTKQEAAIRVASIRVEEEEAKLVEVEAKLVEVECRRRVTRV